jgi:hypothetical protein
MASLHRRDQHQRRQKAAHGTIKYRKSDAINVLVEKKATFRCFFAKSV